MSLRTASRNIAAAMPVKIIVSYDGTTHDDDALMLGRMLAAAGATLSLAYVRHSREYDPRREEIAEHDAQRRLEQGATWLGAPSVATHVVVDPSTSAGLAGLALAEGADLIVFGSDYRTPPGRVEPQGSAQGLLNGGSVAVAVAAAGLRTGDGAGLSSVSVASSDESGAAAQTAQALIAATGAELVPGGRDADLIVVDSRTDTPTGRVALDGTTRGRLDSARGSVLVVARGTPLAF
jgi:nucleotide-binding universal stress UspA family protein